ncbi:hypothetical protein GUITHDRAFT_101903 [Guillardia theta CCMP2712]|uniref:SAP domain-containing protein n=1 Tax=Guillardia theta (strain CCMP2712) TaxID=905079 RepID=L1JVZ4_GUITC|nr:hypothetical protein GUITHDRAFT_101903 [Guillardia theta CCMP2712]EKX52751.1 hypothetical protein GUITHDRAFT_101903 [Guillardia theta CCMP2712]|eukprot:XP_005839731.1 hypothetical protein GUITHDRAFT_101903 [Guillardia theta CCMP2712]
MAMPAACLSFMVANIEARRMTMKPAASLSHCCMFADRRAFSTGRQCVFPADRKDRCCTRTFMAGINGDDDIIDVSDLVDSSAYDFTWDGHDAMVFENFRCSSGQIANHIKKMVVDEPARVSTLIAHFGEESQEVTRMSALGARLLRLTFLSSPLRHLMEDEILGTSTVVSLFIPIPNTFSQVYQDFTAEDILAVAESSETEGARLIVNRKQRDNSVARVFRRKTPSEDERVSSAGSASSRLQDFTVKELKLLCKRQGVPSSGRKSELIERLMGVLDK